MNSMTLNGSVTAGASSCGISLSSDRWPRLRLPDLRPEIGVTGRKISGRAEGWEMMGSDIRVRWSFPETPMVMTIDLSCRGEWLTVGSGLKNEGGDEVGVESITVLGGRQGEGSGDWFGALERVRIYEQDTHWGNVRWGDEQVDRSGRPLEAISDVRSKSQSHLVWMAYHVEDRRAFLAGFLSADRWRGEFNYTVDDRGRQEWTALFDESGCTVGPGETVGLDPLVFGVGDDPWNLLQAYGEAVKDVHGQPRLDYSPVTFCSWYPFRLGVSEERILEIARVGAKRLKAHGLRFIQLDLGWEQGALPGSIQENENFSHGLKWLADRLGEFGFELGAWLSPYSVLENDPLASEHPEWLIRDAAGGPVDKGTWFWDPHGRIFLLDPAKPAVREHLRKITGEMWSRGVRYFKGDFTILVGFEKDRTGTAVIRSVLDADPKCPGIFVSCGGPDIPGPGRGDILYCCMDTGNTGYVSWKDLRQIFTSVACHLFKHRRWGIIQPSCLCVGFPGTITEARARATMAFLSGGEISIGDDLTRLPEERWRILLATVPPLGVSARVIDLFEPLGTITIDYSASSASQSLKTMTVEDRPSATGRVWDLGVKGGWDDWHVVGVFDCGLRGVAEGSKYASNPITLVEIPLPSLGLSPEKDYWVHEFWSGQSIRISKCVPAEGGYQHPGDQQAFVRRLPGGILRVQFFGPDVRLLVIRECREHPWVLASTFHQSGGTEFVDVKWDTVRRVLSGRLNRSVGESGTVYMTAGGREVREVTVNGETLPFRTHMSDVPAFDVICKSDETVWEVGF